MSTDTLAAPAVKTGDHAKPTAAVIGAGFGGLALAIRLQSMGFATTLVDNRDKPGGRAYVYEQDGFKFDGGPTVITDPDCLRELWELSGRKMEDYVELLPVDPFYQLRWEDGDTLNYTNDQSELEAEIARYNPADVKGYRKFLAYSQDLYREGEATEARAHDDCGGFLEISGVRLRVHDSVLLRRRSINAFSRKLYSAFVTGTGGLPTRMRSLSSGVSALR